MIFSSSVPFAFDASSVVNYLSRRFTYLSVEAWRGQFAEGRISKNGSPCQEEDPVAVGDVIAFTLDQDEFPEPPADGVLRRAESAAVATPER